MARAERLKSNCQICKQEYGKGIQIMKCVDVTSGMSTL